MRMGDKPIDYNMMTDAHLNRSVVSMIGYTTVSVNRVSVVIQANEGDGTRVFSPATDIGDAWELIRKLAKHKSPSLFPIVRDYEFKHYVEIWANYGLGGEARISSQYGTNIMRAICASYLEVSLSMSIRKLLET